MKQLGNQDAGFIYNETATTPMHIAGLGIYDQSTAPGQRLGHKDIIKYVQDRIHLAPIFRYKYVEVPFGIDKPYWIEDPDFNVEFHIRHIALPQPGDWRQLCIMVSRLNSRALDFNHPLWEAYVIEGLDNIEGLPKGSFAILVKVHHAIVDGASGQSIFGALHDLTPDAKATEPVSPLTVERNPTAYELIGRAIPNIVRKPFKQTASIYHNAPKMLSTLVKLVRGSMQSGTRLRVPQTRFNYHVSPHRIFEGTHFALEDIKYIKNALGQNISVNDVMLAIVAGGLQHYLKKHDEFPSDSLCAMLPQDVRSDSDAQSFGNQVGGLFADIHTNIENPIDRLIAIHDSTTQAKQFAQEFNTSAVVQNYMGGFLSPRLGRTFNHLMQSSHLIERFGPFACNTLVTNVPGPNFPLYHAGAKMVAYWGLPPIMDCLGLSHAVFSYCGKISLSAVACRQMMPDPAFYIECIEQSFEELLKAAKQYQKERAVADDQSSTEPASSTEKPTRKRAASAKKATSDAAHSTTQKHTEDTVQESAKPDANTDTSNKPKIRKRAASSKSTT